MQLHTVCVRSGSQSTSHETISKRKRIDPDALVIIITEQISALLDYFGIL